MRTQQPAYVTIRVITVIAIVLATALLGTTTAFAQDFGERVSGQRVYDRAGLLTEEEISNLEALAEDVEAAGAPVVVYLRAQDSNVDDTLQDGRDLMETWDVQSSDGARDGVVIFMNLDPDELRRGDLALIAGEAHFDGGNLPQRELDRIRDRMIDELAEDQTAEGIATGLEMIATSLETGPAPPPAPSRFEEISEDIAGGIVNPLNIVAAVVAAGVAYIGRKLWTARPRTDVPETARTTPPDRLIPAAAGALVTRTVSDAQIEATILDFARRGALAFEPEDDDNKKIRLQLLDRDLVENPFEAKVWNALDAYADENGTISSKELANVRSKYGPARDALKSSMVDSGWFDPDAASRRVPLYIAGFITLAIGIAALIFTASAESFGALVGTALLFVAGLGAIIAAASYPSTTPAGEAQAAPWRGYLKGVKDARKDWNVDLDMDDAMPYMVAMNAGGHLDERLKRASKEGYSPAWLNGGSTMADWGATGFYPYWIAFHAIATPSAGVSTGGASAGSGGSGGSF